MGEGMIIAYPGHSERSSSNPRADFPKAHPASFRFPQAKVHRFPALVLLSLLLVLMSGCRGATSLATVPDESEAIEILNVLHDNGLEAHKEEVGEENAKQWQILLSPSWFGGSTEVAMANQVLQDNGLPRPTATTQKPTTDSGVFQDEATRKAQQLKEREADLQRKMRLLPGVIGVEVSIVEPEDSAININPYPSTASVLIVTKDEPPNFNADTVRGLVARSVPKLSPENVYVAVTTKPVRPLPWREFGAQRRHKSFDAIGIGVMIILASAFVVLLLQMRRQNQEISALKSAQQIDLHETEDTQAEQTSGVIDESLALRETPASPPLDTTSQRAVT